MSTARERGYTVVELVLVSSALAVVLLATFALLDKTTELFPGDEQRAPAIRDAQVGVHGMTRLLRQAYAISQPAEGATSDVVTVDVVLRGQDRRVTYDCSGAAPGRPGLRRCVRTVQPLPSGPASSQLVVDAVANPGVFRRTGRRTLRVRVEVPAKGEREGRSASHRVVLDGGVTLRNVR